MDHRLVSELLAKGELPTFAQLAEPELVPDSIAEALEGIGPDDAMKYTANIQPVISQPASAQTHGCAAAASRCSPRP